MNTDDSARMTKTDATELLLQLAVPGPGPESVGENHTLLRHGPAGLQQPLTCLNKPKYCSKGVRRDFPPWQKGAPSHACTIQNA